MGPRDSVCCAFCSPLTAHDAMVSTQAAPQEAKTEDATSSLHDWSQIQMNVPMLHLLLCDWCCYRLAVWVRAKPPKKARILWHRQKLVRFCQNFCCARGHERTSAVKPIRGKSCHNANDRRHQEYLYTGHPDTYGKLPVPPRHQSCRYLSRKLTHSSLKTQGKFIVHAYHHHWFVGWQGARLETRPPQICERLPPEITHLAKHFGQQGISSMLRMVCLNT